MKDRREKSSQKSPEKASVPQKRVSYESPEQNFADWINSLRFERTKLGRFLTFLEDRLFFRSSFLVFAFCILLSYLVFLPIQAPLQFRVGEVVNRDLISPFSFEMVDELTTEDKRAKVEAAVLPIYDYDPEVFDRAVLNIYKAFKNVRQAMRENKKPNLAYLKASFENDLGFSVPEISFEWLYESRFHPRLDDALVRILEKWYDQKIAESPERVIPISQNFVTARIIQRNGAGREVTVNKSEILNLQDSEKFQTLDKKTGDRFNEADRSQILVLARSLLLPNLTYNKSETSRRRELARQSVLPVTMSIKRNQVIVPREQAIQPFHKAIFRQIEALQSDRRKSFMALALALVLSLCVWVFYSYIQRFTLNRVKVHFKDLIVMMLIIMCVVGLTKFYLFVADLAFVSRFGHIFSHTVFLAAAPIAAGSMIVGLLITYGEVVWLFTAFLAVCLGVMEDFNFSFMIMALVGGIAAARGVYGCKSRNDIYWAGFRTGLINALILGFLLFVSKVSQDESLLEVWLVIPAGFLGGIFSSFLALMVIPFLESVFHYTTDVRLLELSNLNHPLLKQMIVRAPGTYHHSMMVGNMVEAAAEEIGANPLLGKVMSYYHDIGKMTHANYFIENQKAGVNPHDDISPFMSKTLLVSHVKDGVELAMQYKLGEPLIDAILQHHGTTVIAYFYNKSLDQRPDSKMSISEEQFRYPGPKPQYKESALCMLADSIEAGARSLDEPTPQRLQSIVKAVIRAKYTDGQLDECNLSLKDLQKIENAFVRILIGVYHQRIAYPRAGS